MVLMCSDISFAYNWNTYHNPYITKQNCKSHHHGVFFFFFFNDGVLSKWEEVGCGWYIWQLKIKVRTRSCVFLPLELSITLYYFILTLAQNWRWTTWIHLENQIIQTKNEGEWLANLGWWVIPTHLVIRRKDTEIFYIFFSELGITLSFF